MKVRIYTMVWNEARLLPFFLDHYKWVDRIVAFDNRSTDDTRAILKAAPNVEVRDLDTQGLQSEEAHLYIRNEAWKEARGKADWILIADADEFLFHHDLPGCVGRLYAEGVTVARCYGWQMVAETFPDPKAGPLVRQVRCGVQNSSYSKPVLFRPDQVVESRFGGGAHHSAPTGNVAYRGMGSLALLHYKFLGWDYYWSRVREVRRRSDPAEVAVGWHSHLLGDLDAHWGQYRYLLDNQVDVTT